LRTGLALLALWAGGSLGGSGSRSCFAAALARQRRDGAFGGDLQPLLSVPSKSIHLLASGVWVGGLLCLVGATRDDTLSAFVDDAERVSTAALVAVIAIALSGVIRR
jgi:hypothetical protein